MKDQLNAQASQAMMKELKDNPFGGLGAMLATALVDRMVDSFITPQGVINLVRIKSINSGTERISVLTVLTALTDKDVDFDFKGPDRFVIRFRGTGEQVWQRSGLATWRLSAMHLPADRLTQSMETANR